MLWKALSGAKVDDLKQVIAAATSKGQELHVGTDSLQAGKYTLFVTVCVIHTVGKGGRVLYTKEKVDRLKSLRERLFSEVWRSVQVALELESIAGGDITVHVDANTDEKHLSSKYLQELVGLVVGQGFKHLVKPLSWCASHVADHLVRGKELR